MKKIKTFSFLIAVVVVFTFTNCKSNKKENTKEAIAETEILNKHNSKNAINWEGAYFGTLPCGSCPGINTLIILNKNKTYEKTVEYLESNDVPKTTKGKFTWNKEDSIITLENNFYLVGKKQLFRLDKNKKVVKGELAENYILNKTELEPEPDTNNGYYLQQFIGDDNKEYNIIFNTNPKVPTALIQTKDFKQMLFQTQVWAKGAEYTTNKTKLITNKNKATLFIGKKKINLKEK